MTLCWVFQISIQLEILGKCVCLNVSVYLSAGITSKICECALCVSGHEQGTLMLFCTSISLMTHTDTQTDTLHANLLAHMAHPSIDHCHFSRVLAPLVSQQPRVWTPSWHSSGGGGSSPPQRLPQLYVLLCSMAPFNLGHATCDGRGHRGNRLVWHAWLLQPSLS